jgi:predicted nuclease with TOPRIM domain
MNAASVVVLSFVFTIAAHAQDQPTVEQLRQQLQETQNQLKSSQDRKNELATENERLVARTRQLETDMELMKREHAALLERTYYLRAHLQAWDVFLNRYPQLRARWNAFMNANALYIPNPIPELPEGERDD